MSCHWFVERLKGRFYGKLLTFLRSDNRNLLGQCNSIHLGKVGCFTRKACWTENNPDKFSCMTGFKAKGTDCVGMLNIVLIVGMCSSAVLAQGMIIMHVQWSTTDALSSCLDPSMSCVGREVTWVSATEERKIILVWTDQKIYLNIIVRWNSKRHPLPKETGV